VKNQFKEDFKTSKTTKEATKENKNDVADGHEMYSTWFGNDVIRFSPLLRGGQIGVERSYQGEPSHET